VSAAASQRNGDVRLEEDDNSNRRGRLEVYDGDIEDWTTVCYDGTSKETQEGVAQAVCRQLGFYNFERVNTAAEFE
jgi:hypothetical protein